MAHEWRPVTMYVLEGTYLELHPEAASGLFFIVDSRCPEISIAGALPLQTAKSSAVRRLEREPEIYSKVLDAPLPVKSKGKKR